MSEVLATASELPSLATSSTRASSARSARSPGCLPIVAYARKVFVTSCELAACVSFVLCLCLCRFLCLCLFMSALRLSPSRALLLFHTPTPHCLASVPMPHDKTVCAADFSGQTQPT